MTQIGAFEAKTYLSQLLQRVEAGERFVITKHNRPVAELIPFQSTDSVRIRSAVESAVEKLKEFQKSHSLDGLSVRQIVEDARKY